MQATRQLEVIACLPPHTFNVTPYKSLSHFAAATGSGSGGGGSSSASGSSVQPSRVLPDAAVLEFAVALTHHHDAITGA
jgi:hypothetical protein